MYQSTTFTFVDARNFDGNPYEAAVQAIAMLDGILQISEKAGEVADLMARNAYMERNLALGNTPAGDKWPETAEGAKWESVREDLNELRVRLAVLHKAAGFDPKAR